MKTIAVLCLIFFTFVDCESSCEPNADEIKFNDWAREFNKTYATPEERKCRFDIFLKSDRLIEAHNENYEKGLETYFLGHNFFSDIRKDEMSEFKGLRTDDRNATETPSCAIPKPDRKVGAKSVPATVDWRGILNPVQFQGKCGSCYSFSTMAAIEAAAMIFKKNKVKLSEQQIIDCSQGFGNSGCGGGHELNVFKYVLSNGGVALSTSYGPYTATANKCKKAQNAIKISDYGRLTRRDENGLKSEVAICPVCVSFDSTDDELKLYKGGIYYNPLCDSSQVDHAVLAVGYGTDNGQDYWLLRNSWGANWGIGGYLKLARNKGSHCGIADDAVYIDI